MKKRLSSSTINGVVHAPASKSEMIRAVAASLLASGTSTISNPSMCSDGLCALGIADALGAEIYTGNGKVRIKGNGGLKETGIKNSVLDCGESGLCIRMFTPVAGLLTEEVTLRASGSLVSRPVRMVEELTGLGAACETSNGCAPVRIKGTIRAGRIRIGGSESSQFLTGLLMALPLCAGDSVVTVSDLKSKPYVTLTVDVLKKFGVIVLHDEDLTDFHIKGNQDYQHREYKIQGDWSGAAFLLIAGALGGSIKVVGLSLDSYQADKAVLQALIKAGARVDTGEDWVSVQKDRLQAFDFDASHCPDLFPPLVALAGGCRGKSTIHGVSRLKNKESDRALALVSEFSKLGTLVRVLDDRMEIDGGGRGGRAVDSHNDHRIAMACAIAALSREGEVIIENPECVSKSYPTFFEDLESVRGIA